MLVVVATTLQVCSARRVFNIGHSTSMNHVALNMAKNGTLGLHETVHEH